jgi:nucleoside-diphosphate-sugar epimerase
VARGEFYEMARVCLGSEAENGRVTPYCPLSAADRERVGHDRRKRIAGSDISIGPKVWAESKNRNTVSEPFNIGRAKRELGFKPQYTMRQAIQHYAGKVRERGF